MGNHYLMKHMVGGRQHGLPTAGKRASAYGGLSSSGIPGDRQWGLPGLGFTGAERPERRKKCTGQQGMK